MKTYFVAGKSVFTDGTTWEFHRLINWTEKDTAHEFLERLINEIENSEKNIKYNPSYCRPEKGQLVLTAFNQV